MQKEGIHYLDFQIDQNSYAIDISYVKEVLLYPEVTHLHHTHECIEGIFILHDQVITVIDLPGLFHLKEHENTKNDMVILSKVSNSYLALHVHNVAGIINADESRIKKDILHWNGKEFKIIKPDKIVKDLCGK